MHKYKTFKGNLESRLTLDLKCTLSEAYISRFKIFHKANDNIYFINSCVVIIVAHVDNYSYTSSLVFTGKSKKVFPSTFGT